MQKSLFRILRVSLLFVVFTFISSSEKGETQTDPQKRLMAKRAAKVDALRNLSETIYGVRIDSSTTVREFVTQSDTIRANLDTLIQGAREVDYVERPDGTAEVTVEITLGQIEDILGRRLSYQYQTFTATGYGAPSGSSGDSSPPVPAAESLRAKGYGIEPRDASLSYAEKALMAKRAAKIDALRNLAEQVKGVRITSDTYVRDFITQSDELRARVNSFIQGARVISEKQMPDGSYEVEVEAEMEPLQRIFSR